MKKQKQVIIICSLCLLLCLCVGYAAFNTQLSIRAKGNVKKDAVDITENVVTSGDGLYVDTYEPGRYIYRGSNPDNYIMFNDELWRIIAKEADGTYKIIRNKSSESWMDFDTNNHRSNANNTFCEGLEFGCSVYAAVDGVFSLPSGSRSGTVTEDSSIKIYLNDDYYVNDINSTAKGQMTSHSFNIGGVEYDDPSSDSIEKNIAGEKMYTWTGNVGLANVSDVVRASTNPLCTSASYSHDTWNISCNNYLFFTSSYSYWTINPIDSESLWVVVRNSSDSLAVSKETAGYDGSAAGVRPVVFLKSDIKIESGTGTESDPYIIEE